MKFMFFFIFLFLGSLNTNIYAAKNKYYFENLSIENGLSQNTVNAILQDRKGFMWFGTKDGLNRYDGTSFREYRYSNADKHCLGNNFVTKLYEDLLGHIWIGTDSGLYIYFPETDMVMSFDHLTSSEIKIKGTVSMITGDNQGQVWISVEGQGLFSYNLEEKKISNFSLKGKHSITTNVECLLFDRDGTIWIGFYGDGLYYSKDNLKTLIPYKDSMTGQEKFKGDPISKIIKGNYGVLYVCSIKGGLNEINLISGKIRNLLLIDEKNERIFCRDLMMFSDDDELWVATETGVYIYNLLTNEYTHLYHSSDDQYSLSDNAIYSLYKDKDGGVWVGSYFGGVDYCPKQYTYFEKYYPDGFEKGLHGSHVREFCEDLDGSLWIGTEDGGLNHFDPKTSKFDFFEASKDFVNIHALCVDNNTLWVGTFSKGLKKINKKTGEIENIYMDGHSIHSYDNSVFSICKTSTGDIFIGTSYGLHIYDRAMDSFVQIPELKGRFIYDILEDSDGILWAATYAHGIYRYNIGSKKWSNYIFDENDSHSLPYNKVISIFEDSHRQLWFTTQGRGFCKFDVENNNFIRYNSQMGLKNDVVYQIIEDNDGLFWLTTNKGLVKFNPKSLSYKNYTTVDGLLSNQFNYRSSYKSKNGIIYFGCIKGFIRFNPDRFVKNTHVSSVVITDLLLYGQKVFVGGIHSPLDKSITYSDKITLKSNQNFFSLRLVSLGSHSMEQSKIVFKLEGFDKEWRSVGESPLATYANMDYGLYYFKAKILDPSGKIKGNELVLTIDILPPFYLTVWAYLFYGIMCLLFSSFLIRFYKKRRARRYKHQEEKFKQEKEHEIYEAKIDFFTNVAHEIRTPLTLIKGPLENIIQKKDLNIELQNELKIMDQNTERLLQLSNQLLDFRRIESKGYRLNFQRTDITVLLSSVYNRFSSLAHQRNLEFKLNISSNHIYADVNREAFTKIVSNLLNNALKYADSCVFVSLEVNKVNTFLVKVTNDGLLIPIDKREEVFKPFVRINEQENKKIATGTGIGLALSFSLAELHSGSLFIDKQSNEYNIFCFILPINQQSSVSVSNLLVNQHEDDAIDHAYTEVQETNKRNLYTILLVEDNLDMLAFVRAQFETDYCIFTAKNGLEALHIMDLENINLVITDVVMPRMDGFELCKTIKSNLEYSHVPVVILTAKTDIQSKIEGLELGADSYVEKPFSIRYLKVNVANLIANREQLRKSFAKLPFASAKTMASTKADEEFLKKMDDIVQLNFHDSEFCIEDLMNGLNISRSNFYRKIKGVLDLTPNEYLRLERLKQAAKLLKNQECSISDVCYRVGFSSPSYFSKCFKKQFGVLPKDFSS